MKWILILFFPLSVFSQKKCSVTIVSKLNKGVAYIGLYDSKESFPNKPFRTLELNMDSLLVLNFITDRTNLAFSCFIDENNDKKLNTFFGVPTEAYGFSFKNSNKSFLPNYEKSLLKIEDGCEILLEVNKIL